MFRYTVQLIKQSATIQELNEWIDAKLCEVVIVHALLKTSLIEILQGFYITSVAGDTDSNLVVLVSKVLFCYSVVC